MTEKFYFTWLFCTDVHVHTDTTRDFQFDENANEKIALTITCSFSNTLLQKVSTVLEYLLSLIVGSRYL